MAAVAGPWSAAQASIYQPSRPRYAGEEEEDAEEEDDDEERAEKDERRLPARHGYRVRWALLLLATALGLAAALSARSASPPAGTASGGGGGHDFVRLDETSMWVCRKCGHIYNAKTDGGGKPFEELPETWECPTCGWRKEEYTLKHWENTEEPASADFAVPG
mmetsp:Transcript_75312/g.232946  ORF Transcript_75312/g.232946 Transcript_75312/m.232946 type:complete len:163 (-) Transcript_75312:45-533(-)